MSFLSPTENVFQDKVYMKDLYQNSSEPNGWTASGEINVLEDNYIFKKGTELVSPEFDGSLISDLTLTLSMKTLNIGIDGLEIYNYIITLEYSDGDSVELRTPLKGPNSGSYKEYHVTFNNIKNEKFRLRINSAFISLSGGHIYIRDFYLSAVLKSPELDIVPGNTGFVINPKGNYDECVFEIYRQVPLESGVDTLFFNDFEDGKADGIVTNIYPSISYVRFGLTEKKTDLYVTIPFIPNKSIDKFNLEFSSLRISSIKNVIDILYNNNFVSSITHSKEDYVYNWKYEIDVMDLPVDSITFYVEYDGDNTTNLILEDILITQNCEYRYSILEDYPKQVSIPSNIDGLECNSSYRVRYQFIDNGNDDGERIVTNIGECYIETTGEFLQLPPGSSYTLDSDFEGTIMMSDKADLYGNYNILGQLCYVLEFLPGQWHSVGLPFKPWRIGGFIDGEGFYLRENADFYLRSYDDDSDNGGYVFTDAPAANAYEGYILKVPESLSFDNNALFVYSDRGMNINGDYQYSFSGLYNHVVNPYTYSLSYGNNQETIDKLFGDNVIYKFDGTLFKLFTVNDELEPFESVIVFTGGLNGAPKMIRLEDEPTGLTEKECDDAYMISIYNDGFIIDGYSGNLKIYSSDGILIRDTSISENEYVSLGEKGVYILMFNDNKEKIIL